MFHRLIHTNEDVSALLLRLALGIVMLPHGSQKVLPPSMQESLSLGGHGFSGTLQFFTEQMQIPSALAVLAIIAEFFGALGLLVGLLTRVAAFGIACVMGVAVYMVHWKQGFFMNWLGTQQGEGYEYHILALGMALALMLKGGGTASVDRALSAKKRS
jgi:putative oxidoreductase